MANAGLGTSVWRKARAAVLAREDRCYLCGELVDKSLPGSSPAGPTVDHTKARSAGGSLYDPSNLHLAHNRCNAQKNAMPLSVYRYRQAKSLEHSREW